MGSSVSFLAPSRERKLSFTGALQALQILIPNVSRFKAAPLSDIDIELNKQRKEEQYVHKILLLGAGECGKSTVLKQVCVRAHLLTQQAVAISVMRFEQKTTSWMHFPTCIVLLIAMFDIDVCYAHVSQYMDRGEPRTSFLVHNLTHPSPLFLSLLRRSNS
jgi:hypothetical protein